ELDIDYLLGRIDDEIVRDNLKLEQVDDPKAIEDLANLITFLAKGVEWEEETNEVILQTIAPDLLEKLHAQQKQLDERNNEKVKLLKEIDKLKQEKKELQTSLEQSEQNLGAQSVEPETKDESTEDVE